MLARIRTAIAKRRLERLVTRQRASFDAARSEAAKKGQATRKATAAKVRYNRFITDPLVRVVLEERHRGSSSYRRTKRQMLIERDGSKCHWCSRQLQTKEPTKHDYATLDHIVPHSLGGSLALDNLVLACVPCNSERGHEQSRLPLKIKNTRTALFNAVVSA